MKIFNTALGFLFLILFLTGVIDGLLFSFCIIFNLFVFYIYEKDLFQTFMAFITFPFGLFLPKTSNEISLDLPQEEKTAETSQKEDVFDFIIPLKTALYMGTPQEKKEAILKIINSVLEGNLRASEATAILKKMISSTHPDVSLYASESLDTIENFLIKEMYFSKDPIKFSYVALEYVKSGYVYGELLEYYKKLIHEKLIGCEMTVDYYIIKHELTGDVEILYKGYEVTKSEKIKNMIVEYEMERRNFKKVKELLSS